MDKYLELIDALDTLIEDTNWEIREKAKEDKEAELLSTIHGVGYYSALLIKSK